MRQASCKGWEKRGPFPCRGMTPPEMLFSIFFGIIVPISFPVTYGNCQSQGWAAALGMTALCLFCRASGSAEEA